MVLPTQHKPSILSCLLGNQQVRYAKSDKEETCKNNVTSNTINSKSDTISIHSSTTDSTSNSSNTVSNQIPYNYYNQLVDYQPNMHYDKINNHNINTTYNTSKENSDRNKEEKINGLENGKKKRAIQKKSSRKVNKSKLRRKQLSNSISTLEMVQSWKSRTSTINHYGIPQSPEDDYENEEKNYIKDEKDLKKQDKIREADSEFINTPGIPYFGKDPKKKKFFRIHNNCFEEPNYSKQNINQNQNNNSSYKNISKKGNHERILNSSNPIVSNQYSLNDVKGNPNDYCQPPFNYQYPLNQQQQQYHHYHQEQYQQNQDFYNPNNTNNNNKSFSNELNVMEPRKIQTINDCMKNQTFEFKLGSGTNDQLQFVYYNFSNKGPSNPPPPSNFIQFNQIDSSTSKTPPSFIPSPKQQEQQQNGTQYYQENQKNFINNQQQVYDNKLNQKISTYKTNQVRNKSPPTTSIQPLEKNEDIEYASILSNLKLPKNKNSFNNKYNHEKSMNLEKNNTKRVSLPPIQKSLFEPKKNTNLSTETTKKRKLISISDLLN